MVEDFRETASSVEFKFVSVGPIKQSIVVAPGTREAIEANAEEKKTWGWVHSENVGVPCGLRDSASATVSTDTRIQQLLASIAAATDSRPPLVRFSTVKESQLIKDGLPINLYAKANYLQHQELVYKLHKADGKLVRSILECAGFCATDSHDWNILWAGCAPQLYHYEGLHEYQKINHFPGSTELTRKDNLCVNIMKMQERFGKPSFDFLPETFVLPSEFADFYDRFEESAEATWIAKPAASSQGKGIFLVENISQVPLEEPYILSKYIHNPFLINGLKFDLRIYVLVSGYDPLRIYVYREGLARFASEEYTSQRKDAKFAHLTNYSINKKNDHFVQNQDYRKDDIGHKWSLSALFRHLSDVGVDTDFLWSKIYDLVIKTIISIEEIVVENIRELSLNRGNCFDLFGFDVLLDSSLKPWLLEVNLSPSLGTDSPLDLYIKGNLIADTFNLVGVRAFDRKKEALSRVKARIRAKRMSHPKASTQKPAKVRPVKSKDAIRDVLEEFQRKGRFLCIYPSSGSNVYEQFFAQPRELNRLLFEVLFEDAPLAEKPLPVSELVSSHTSFSHARNASFTDNRPRPPANSRLRSSASKEKTMCTISVSRVHVAPRQEKIVITGDDILMEYISRLTRAIMSIQEDGIQQCWRDSIEGFLSHPVWKGNDPKTQGRDSLWQRLEGRFQEMRERHLRMLEAQARQQGNAQGRNIAQSEKRREIVATFTSQQLEDMLRASTKNIAREVVMPLLEGGGVLSDILSTDAMSTVPAGLEEEQPEVPDIPRRSSLEHTSVPQVLPKLVLRRPRSIAKSLQM